MKQCLNNYDNKQRHQKPNSIKITIGNSFKNKTKSIYTQQHKSTVKFTHIKQEILYVLRNSKASVNKKQHHHQQHSITSNNKLSSPTPVNNLENNLVSNNTKISEYILRNENKIMNNKSKRKPSRKDFSRLINCLTKPSTNTDHINQANKFILLPSNLQPLTNNNSSTIIIEK